MSHRSWSTPESNVIYLYFISKMIMIIKKLYNFVFCNLIISLYFLCFFFFYSMWQKKRDKQEKTPKRWFWLGNGVRSTRLFIKINNKSLLFQGFAHRWRGNDRKYWCQGKVKHCLVLMCKSCKQKLSNSIRNAFPILLYLSGLNMMEGILNKEQFAKVPSKTKKPS